jgi:uncharacterized membrane protein
MIINLTIKQRLVLVGFIIFFFSLYTVQAVLNHYFLRTYALDYGFYNQAFWDFAHLRINSNTVFEPQLENYFQIHPAFTLPLISPLYWIFAPVFGTYSLLIIQNIFILLGGFGTYLLVKRKTGQFWIALLAFIHYNLIWGHFSAISSDYIDTTVASSMVPLFFLYFDKKKYWIAAFFFLMVITCKENMPIWFIFISLALILLYKDKQSRLVAAVFGLFSFVYLIFLFKVLIPHFQIADNPYWGFAYSVLGKTPGEALSFVLRHPLESIRLSLINHSGNASYDYVKWEFYVGFLVSGGLLLFRRPVYLLLFVPIIAQKVLNDSPMRWGITGFYSIEAVSILTMAVFLATSDIRQGWPKYLLYVALCICTAGFTWYKIDRRVTWYDPSKENLLSADFYGSPNNAGKIIKKIEHFIPDNARVAAMQDIVPHLSFRKNISIFPYVHDAEYIILLMNGNKYPMNEKTFNVTSDEYLHDPRWEKVLQDYPLIILKRL